jgi:hypothetical protein
VECGFKQRELVAKLQVGGWNLSAESLCKIEVGDRTLTDVELAFILQTLKRSFSDLHFPKIVFPRLMKNR